MCAVQDSAQPHCCCTADGSPSPHSCCILAAKQGLPCPEAPLAQLHLQLPTDRTRCAMPGAPRQAQLLVLVLAAASQLHHGVLIKGGQEVFVQDLAHHLTPLLLSRLDLQHPHWRVQHP